MMVQEGSWMMICMMATMLFAFIIGVFVIIQTFIQVKLLKEFLRLNSESKTKI